MKKFDLFCSVCKKKLKPGDKVVMTFTLYKDNFSELCKDSFQSSADDLQLFLCVGCCENMNFIEYSKEEL